MVSQEPLQAQRESCLDSTRKQVLAFIAGPKWQLKAEWWDQANLQPKFVNAFGLLFDSNKGPLHSLAERKPSLILRLPNRLAFPNALQLHKCKCTPQTILPSLQLCLLLHTT